MEGRENPVNWCPSEFVYQCPSEVDMTDILVIMGFQKPVKAEMKNIHRFRQQLL